MKKKRRRQILLTFAKQRGALYAVRIFLRRRRAEGRRRELLVQPAEKRGENTRQKERAAAT
jgi:hypothetical protein